MPSIWSLLLLTIFMPRHDFHVSIAQVDYKQQSLQMTLRVFTEDLEDRLEEQSGLDLDLGSPTEHEEAPELIAEYLREVLAFEADGMDLPMRYIGLEVEYELSYLYVEFPCVEPPKELLVRNQIFFDSFDDQSNIVNVKVGEELRSAFLSPGEGETILEF